MLKYGDILVQDHQRFWSNCGFCVQPLHPSALTRRNYWAIVPIAILELLSYVHPVVLIFLQFFCERKLLMVNRGFERPFWCFHDIFFWRKERKNEDLQATVEEIFWLSLSSLFLGRRWQISFLDVSDFLPAWTFLPLTAKALAWHFRCLPSVNCPQNFLFTLSAQNCRKLNFAVPSKYKSKSKWGRVKKDDSVLILLESLVKTVKLSQALEWSELMPVVKLVKGPNPIDTNTVYQMIVAQIGN